MIEKLNDTSLFTTTELEVISYIQQHIEDIPHMTIGKLAQEAYSSNATIIRICHKLGCKGFVDFKQLLLKELESQKYSKQTIDFTKPFYLYDSPFDTINQLSQLYKESIDIIHASLDSRQLDRMAKTIIESNRLFIYSIGDTNLTVRNFMNKLLKINIYPISATDNHEELYTSRNIQKSDCVLFVSYSGLSHHYLECANIIKQTHCPIMLITANTKSPLVALADEIIFIDNKEKDERTATFYSQLAFQYILTLLYALIYRRIKRTEL